LTITLNTFAKENASKSIVAKQFDAVSSYIAQISKGKLQVIVTDSGPASSTKVVLGFNAMKWITDSSTIKNVGSISVNFGSNSYTLSAAAKKSLTTYLKSIVAKGVKQILVTGYTDNVGRGNLKLSAARANAVVNFINVNKFNLVVSTRGSGASNPVADNATSAGRAQNRRATVTPIR
jgi:outer membrane protein OmpA-like peptidoglycan-associated protein